MGVPFDHISFDSTLLAIEGMIKDGSPHYVVTANVDFLVQAYSDLELKRILLDADLVLCDGTPLLWASQLMTNPLPERVAGSDLVPRLIAMATERGYRVFMLGGAEGVAEEAARKMQQHHPGLKVVGTYSPPFKPLLEMDHEATAKIIQQARPDILLVAFGCPKQEKWMSMHLHRLGVPVMIGVGATLDFLAGRMKRAPRWMQRTGTEWLFRLAQEPRRLASRYGTDFWHFGYRMGTQLMQVQFRRRSKAQVNLHSPNGDEAWQTLHFPCSLTANSVPLLTRSWQEVRRPLAAMLETRDTSDVDDTGIAFLMRMEKHYRSKDLRIALLQPHRALRRILRAHGLHQLIPIVEREEDFAALLSDLREGGKPTDKGVHPEQSSGPLGQGKLSPWVWEVTSLNCEKVSSQTKVQIQLLAKLHPLLTLDLGLLRFIDSSGIGLMRQLQAHANELGAQLVFLNPTPVVRAILRKAKVEREFFQPLYRSNHNPVITKPITRP